MARFKCLWMCVLAALLPLKLFAQEPLPLDRAISIALAQNPRLRAAHAGVDEAAANAIGARSSFWPRIRFSESWQRGDEPVFVFSSLLASRQFTAANFAIDALNHPDPIGLFHTRIGIEQLVFDGGGRSSAAAEAAIRQDIARLSTDELAAAVVVGVTQAFGRVMTARATLRAATDALAAAREDLARAERRRDAGMATDADALALAVHVANLEQRRVEAEGEIGMAQADLNQYMGEPIERDVQISEPAPTSLDALQISRDLTALFAEADAARPEVRRTAGTVRAAEEVRRQARAGLIPQASAQAGFDINGTRFGDRASSWIVGGELRWSFSLGGAELAADKAAAAALVRARAEADAARAAVHVDVVTALRRLESAQARQTAGRAAVEQARESQRIIRDRFEAGVAPVNDVLQASASLIDAEANRTAASVDTMVAAAALRRSLGRIP